MIYNTAAHVSNELQYSYNMVCSELLSKTDKCSNLS